MVAVGFNFLLHHFYLLNSRLSQSATAGGGTISHQPEARTWLQYIVGSCLAVAALPVRLAALRRWAFYIYGTSRSYV